MEEEYSNLLDQAKKEEIDSFIKFHLEKGNKLVLITSGGTTVPLEQNTVRFIDNFSIGTRGSASAEYFIEKSYAVLFVHRRRSLKPYERKFHNVNILEVVEIDKESKKSEPRYTINQSLIHFNFNSLLQTYNSVKAKNFLLNIEFITLFDYLAVLEYCCKQVNSLGNNVIIYLAAAVSDFYLPKNEMPTHKIQSGYGGLDLCLKPVPKLVGKLKNDWCPNAYIVTFKLETDPNLLKAKSQSSLDKYKHQVVIGNILENRKNNVSIIESNGTSTEINLDDQKNATKHKEIEELIVEFLASRHSSYKSNV